VTGSPHREGTLGGVLVSHRRRRFVGREAELELARSALDESEPQFAVLWISGPGGIGKTSLLDAIAEQAAADPRVRIVRFDGRDPDPSPSAILGSVRSALAGAGAEPATRDPPPRLVLILDAFERLGGLHDWVRTGLLPALPADSLTFVACRDEPGEAWRADPAWRELLRVVSLRNLAPEACRKYLRVSGVDDRLHDHLVRLSHGHPLGLSLLVDVVMRRGDVPLEPLTPDVVGSIMRRFVDVVPAGPRRTGLEVCALARVTTEQLLRETLSVELAAEVFGWLRGLSFVESGREGLQPHDLARDVLDADLRWRDPQEYKEVFRRVRSHIYTTIKSAGGREQQRAGFDLKFLFRNLPSVLSPVDWEAWGQHYPEPAAGDDDRRRILQLLASAEGEASAAIAEHWLQVQPDAFLVVRREGELLGFLATLDLTAAAEHDRRADPGALAAWAHAHRHAPPRPGEVVTQTRFIVDAEQYQGPSPTLNAVPIATLQGYLRTPRLAWDYLALHEPEGWDSFFALADLPRATDADFSVGGRRYGLYCHDFRRVPVDALMDLWTERALAQDPTLRPVEVEPAVALSQAEFTDAVRQALKDLHRAELLLHNPLLRTRLARERAHPREPDPDTLRALVQEATDSLRRQPRDDKLFRAVERTYLRPAPTQEAAAEVLGLPFSTYRRHLSHGIARVVAWLWDQEVYGWPGTHRRGGAGPGTLERE
jgi:hypothetical protein